MSLRFQLVKGERRDSSPPASLAEASASAAPAEEGSIKKILYFVRHAEALHNVKEREAVQKAIEEGETDFEKQQEVRRAFLLNDHQNQLRDAPLSSQGRNQARASGRKLSLLFGGGSAAVFRRPDVVLVSPLRRALMTATELFLHTDDNSEPPLFLAIEALREKRTGLTCDERSTPKELRRDFPHVDFSDVERGETIVPIGENNDAVRIRSAKFIDGVLRHVEGTHIALVSHKGWLRELRKTLKNRVDEKIIKADFDVNEWDKTLYGNAEVRVAAVRWQYGELSSIVSRSVDNAKNATMMGDGFEFALGPPSSGFSMFLADRTTKVHFIGIAEGQHNVAIRHAFEKGGIHASRDVLLRGDGKAPDHFLFDARLTMKGAKQAKALRSYLSTRPSQGRPFTAFELVITSPLTRAMQTTEIVFGQNPGTFSGEEIPPPRILVKEECRERYGQYVCDGRRTVSELSADFPSFDFSELRESDELYSDEPETAAHCRERAVALLEWLSSRPERCVAVVTHSEFLRHLFGQFGDTLEDEDRSYLQRTTDHCELRSVVLCAHGGRKQTHAPASTMQIRSNSSSSLTTLAIEK